MASATAQRVTPSEVEINDQPRQPVSDPTLGIPVAASERPEAKHRLVTIGDSLTHGFMSGAIYRTDLSWPAIVAYELGLTRDQFRFPTYEWPTGPGGLPLDLERLIRAFQRRYGDRLDFWEIVSAAVWLRGYMDKIEDYWEAGEGAKEPAAGDPFHNLAVYGWDVLDAALLTADVVSKRIRPRTDAAISQLVENHGDRAARVVLKRAKTPTGLGTVLDAAAAMSQPPEGIETLVVALGSNNALGAVVGLKPSWTPADYHERSPEQRLEDKRKFNVWRPSAFAADWALLTARLRTIAAQHVIISTVPSVTIAPIARGVSGKVRPTSRYFPYYTRPWVSDADFDPRQDPCLTEAEARGIDSAIDAYNQTIIDSVRQAREDGLDWYVFDLGGLLDRLAVRRYIDSPWARPTWWTPYELPDALRALDPVPNTRFFRSGPDGRTDGGLFSLDGVHPTTAAYGVLAQEIIAIMESAGVTFRRRDGQPRSRPVRVDFDRLLSADSLLSNPPAAVSPTLAMLGWLDERLDWVNRVLPFVSNPL